MIWQSAAALTLAAAPACAIGGLAVGTGGFERPPQGWNAWFAFDRDVTADGILANAAALVRTGLKDVGYTYVNVDDAWAGPRRADGTPTADNATFPSGIQSLASSVHRMGEPPRGLSQSQHLLSHNVAQA